MSTKVALLGQSNSILKDGFFNKFLEKHQPIEVTAMGRIGASPSLLGPYFAKESFFGGSEFCIIDMCVIDFSLLSGGAIGLYDISKWIEWVCHSAKRAGCEPIFVCIPVHPANHSELLISNCISLIERNEWFYLDVRGCIARLVERTGRTPGELYRDPSRPGPELSEAIADSLAQIIDEIRHTPMKAVSRTFPVSRFDVLNLQGLLSAAQANYLSSLLDFKGVRLERGKAYQLTVGGITGVSGLMLNSAACKGVLEINGDRKFYKNLRLRPYHPTRFEARLVPICKPLRDNGGLLKFSLVDSSIKESDITFHSAKTDEDNSGFVEIADIVVERGYDLLTYSSRRPATS
ncbi:hypothetical protein [Nitrobacter sp. JJSN]|uniref:hypothetical protein n=1 Tax=Nitrobacter sp. JJSN TaxID=3453033 RepID=UPI003F765A26